MGKYRVERVLFAELPELASAVNYAKRTSSTQYIPIQEQ